FQTTPQQLYKKKKKKKKKNKQKKNKTKQKKKHPPPPPPPPPRARHPVLAPLRAGRCWRVTRVGHEPPQPTASAGLHPRLEPQNHAM
ncbi:hypothetical protein, partial [Nocardia abscessus]|uniref:hypothetical protein n=1 Tax=Nocardia abscessus TaxID=120957 RepID=UPI0024556CFB